MNNRWWLEILGRVIANSANIVYSLIGLYLAHLLGFI